MQARRPVPPVVLLALMGVLPTVIVMAPARAAPLESFTPAILRVMSRPSWFRGTDGKVHLELDGRSPPLDELLAINPVTTPVPIDRNGAGVRRDELPLGRDLVTFAGPRR